MPPVPSKYVTGIYKLTNLVSRKIYVGSTSVTFDARFESHFKALRLNRHSNRHLQAAWHLYGPQTFTFSILERCHPDRCVAREQFWIDKLDSTNPSVGYNFCKVARSARGVKRSKEFCEGVSRRKTGEKHTQESRQKMSAAHKLRLSCPEAKARHDEIMRGESRRQKISIANKGKTRSEELRTKISASVSRSMTEEAKQHLREKANEQWSSDEQRRKRSELSKQQWADPVRRERLLLARKLARDLKKRKLPGS